MSNEVGNMERFNIRTHNSQMLNARFPPDKIWFRWEPKFQHLLYFQQLWFSFSLH